MGPGTLLKVICYEHYCAIFSQMSHEQLCVFTHCPRIAPIQLFSVVILLAKSLSVPHLNIGNMWPYFK